MLNHIPNDGCMIFEKTFKRNLMLKKIVWIVKNAQKIIGSE
jgi:hypothetical protein